MMPPGAPPTDGATTQLAAIMQTLATWLDSAPPGERRASVAHHAAGGGVVVTLERRVALSGEDLVDALGQAATLVSMKEAP